MILALARTAAVALALVLAACGGSPQSASPPAAAPSSAAPSPTPSAAAVTAKQILDQLVAAGLPVTNGAVQDENTDPNNLLGRPNGYLHRASFDVPGGDPDAEKGSVDRGGVIEVWADAAGAKARAEFIQTTLKAAQILGTEYHYLNGPVLVRVTGKVKPSVAKPFEAAVAALKL